MFWVLVISFFAMRVRQRSGCAGFTGFLTILLVMLYSLDLSMHTSCHKAHIEPHNTF